MLLLGLLACPGPDGGKGPADTADTATDTAGDDTGDTAGDDTGETGDTFPECDYVEPEPPETRDTGDGPLSGDRLAGEITWTLAFDDDAEAQGYVDCTYTRLYAAQDEIVDLPWLCPDCALLTTGSAEMTSGYDDCYVQIDDADAVRTELLGVGDVDGATHFFRSGRENLSLGDMGEIVGTADAFDVAWEDEATLDAGGTMVLSAAGSFTRTADAVSGLADPTAARAEAYACGWPQNNPGGDDASWDLAIGSPVPNLRLDDQCGEAVDTWDFLGYYLVIDASSPDCGPCQSMASGAEAWKAEMEARCVPVELITLLNADLSDVLTPADLETRQAWAEFYGLTSPVLGDRGFAYASMAPISDNPDGISMPTVFVVDPEGVLLTVQTGFGDWSTFTDTILADWETRR